MTLLPFRGRCHTCGHDHDADTRTVRDVLDAMGAQPASRDRARKFQLGERVRKTKGSRWEGRVVGTYSTALTPEGYAVESDTEVGSVQIYPAAALEPAPNERA